MMKSHNLQSPEDSRSGWCPIYDTPCPKGAEAAAQCTARFDETYDPMTNLRDAALTFCAIQRTAEGFGVQTRNPVVEDAGRNINQSFEPGGNS